MASTQVCRLQQRVSALQSHHKMASIRHLEANNNYIAISNNMMNTLMCHLKSTDKNAKKTKRITKPRAVHSQLSKSTRLTGKVCATQIQTEQSDFTQPISNSEMCIKSVSSKEFCSDNFRNECDLSKNVQEPIFPPPTYPEPVLSSQISSSDLYYENEFSNNYSWKDWSSDCNAHIELYNSSEQNYMSCTHQFSDNISPCYYCSVQYKQYNNNNNDNNNNNNSNNSKLRSNSNLNQNYSRTEQSGSSWTLGSSLFDEIPHNLKSRSMVHSYSNMNNNINNNNNNDNHYIDEINNNHSQYNSVQNQFIDFLTNKPVNMYHNQSYSVPPKTTVNPILASTYPPVNLQRHTSHFNPESSFRAYNWLSQYPIPTTNCQKLTANMSQLSNNSTVIFPTNFT